MRGSASTVLIGLAALGLVGSLLTCGPPSMGAPPAASDPDSETAAWYRSLIQPGTGIGCCSIADCRPLADADWRQTERGYEVRWRGDWLAVPQERILDRIENPTGQPVACVYGTPAEVHCFVRPSES